MLAHIMLNRVQEKSNDHLLFLDKNMKKPAKTNGAKNIIYLAPSAKKEQFSFRISKMLSYAINPGTSFVQYASINPDKSSGRLNLYIKTKISGIRAMEIIFAKSLMFAYFSDFKR